MLLELHMLQNFSPSNLNRDDTGSPKDCEFGGYRRTRISSQCQKRAIRLAFRDDRLLAPEHLALRTKRLTDEVGSRLSKRGRDVEQARQVAENALAGIKIKLADRKSDEDEWKTQYLLFLGAAEIERVTEVCDAHWEALAATQAAGQKKKDAKAGVPKEVTAALERALDGGRAADLALFGRMLADLPERNIVAASQVAHALSTNRMEQSFDFYTAVDDLKPDDNAGADMIGTVEFNSSCFYRYANVDLCQLNMNLGEDEELARATVRAFLQAAVTAVPAGKQTSFAAQNPPSLIFAVLRERGFWSLANAFVKPVSPDGTSDLVGGSVRALDDYWGRLSTMYGTKGLIATPVCVDPAYAGAMSNLTGVMVPNVPALIDSALEAVSFASCTRGAG